MNELEAALNAISVDLREIAALRAQVEAKDDALATQADALAKVTAERDALREALTGEREENLWNAYHTGHEKDGRWTHMFMSDGEWLAQQCGFDPRLPDYDAAEVKAAIPKAARTALTETSHDRA